MNCLRSWKCYTNITYPYRFTLLAIFVSTLEPWLDLMYPLTSLEVSVSVFSFSSPEWCLFTPLLWLKVYILKLKWTWFCCEKGGNNFHSTRLKSLTRFYDHTFIGYEYKPTHCVSTYLSSFVATHHAPSIQDPCLLFSSSCQVVLQPLLESTFV